MSDASSHVEAKRSPLLGGDVLNLQCPNCEDRGGLRPFYSIDRIPAHSCLLMDTHDDAIGYPCGTLNLAFCSGCGFISNASYEESLKDYSPRYEETQHFSDCFNSFAKRLARRWVEQYDVRNKTVLEIGCGKGEFLELLCTIGNNRGIGFDPGVHPERLSHEANARIRFIKDYYSEEYRHEQADVICCRHTLEHISEPDRLISAIRHNIGDRDDVIMLFELPDTTRVLRECAFWDLYYEHCSYFTATSLAELFRRNQFELLELERDYDDQYLLLVARPCTSPLGSRLAPEDDLDGSLEDIEDFRVRHRSVIDRWRNRIRDFAADGKRTVLWGGGSKGVSFLTTLGLGSEVDCVVDINPHKHGKFMPGTGHRVVGPQQLVDRCADVVIVMNPIYTGEIRDTLQAKGLTPTLLPLGV